MRKINIKTLLIITITTGSIAGAVHVVHVLQAKRSAAALIAQADRAEKRGDGGQAAQYLERYLSYVPGDTVAMTRYAKLLTPADPQAEPVAARQAASVYEKVLARNPEAVEVRRRLAKLDIERGDSSAALTHLEILMPSRPDDGNLELMRGKCLQATGHDEEAAKWYEKARKHKPDLIEAYGWLAYLQRRRLSRPKEADRVMDAVTVKDGLISANGKSFRAYLDRAQYRREFGLAGAREDVARALELAPDDADAILAAAQAARSEGPAGLDRARVLLNHGLELHPKVSMLYEALATVEQEAGHPDAAAACLKRGVAALPDQVDLRWTLTDLLITAGNLAEATGSIDELRKMKVVPETLGFVNARLLFQERKWAEAARLLETTAPTLMARAGIAWLAKRAYLLLGQCYEQLGNVDLQFAAYRRAVDIVLPGGFLDLPARLGLASSLAARDRLDEAIGEYRKILALPGSPPGIRIVLARLVILQTLRLPAADRRWADADRALDDAEKAIPGSSDVVALRGEVLTARGQAEKAVTMIREARKRMPDRVDLWVDEAALEARQGRNDVALNLIDEAEKRLGRRIELRSARARYWARRGGADAVAALAEIERGAGDLGRGDRLRLLGTLADSYATTGSPERSRSLKLRLADEDPTNLPLRIALFDQSMIDGDETSAKKYLGEIERLDVEGSLGPYGRALLLIHQSQSAKGKTVDGDRSLVEARRLLTEAAKIRPSWSRIAVAEARIDEIENRPESALADYLRAIELGENGTAIVRAAQLLYDKGKYAQADQVFQKLQNRSDLTGEQRRMAADLALRSRDLNRAMAEARAAVATDPKDYRNLLWLGRVLGMVGLQTKADGRASAADGLFVEAEQAFRGAVALAKNVGVPHVALVQFLAEIGRKDQAQAAIKEARRLLPPKEATLALAQCLGIAGNSAEAEEAYRAALAASPDDPATLQSAATYQLSTGHIKEAEGLLRRLAALESKSSVEAGWARRTLAIIMASGGNARRASEALSLIGSVDGSGSAKSPGPRSVQDRRARAMILAVQANREQHKEAIKLMEDILQEGSVTADDRFMLARLYESEGNWNKAREQLLILMTSDAKDPRYGTYYTLNLLKRGQVGEAQSWVSRMERDQPDSPATVELKARVLHAAGRKTEALATISAFLRGHAAQIIPFAGVLEVLKEFDEAEKLLRRAVAEGPKPQSTFALIGFLGRRGRTKEALALCDATWSPTTTGAVANAYIQTMAVAETLDDADMERIATRFEAWIKAHPQDIVIPLHLANLRTFQGKTAKAEAIFRSLADREKNNAIPLNNLAWLLALEKGQEAKALPIIKRAIEIQGESPNVLDTRALAYMALGRAKDAVQDMENAIVRSPVATKYYHMARAYRLAGRRDEAAQALKQAGDLGLTVADVHPLERQAYRDLVADLAKKQ